MENGHGQESDGVLGRHLGAFSQSAQPQRQDIEQPKRHLQCGRGPCQGGCQVQAGLAENVVKDAKYIPQDEQDASVERFLFA